MTEWNGCVTGMDYDELQYDDDKWYRDHDYCPDEEDE